MRSLRHLTPRYLYNRTRWMFFEMRNPQLPWLNQQVMALLPTLLLKTDRGLEWGSGRSTRWFAQHLAHLTSVENDTAWHAKVKADLERDHVANVEYLLRPNLEGDAASEYVRAADNVPDSSLGFALVDGQLREQCGLAVIPKIALGGLLVWDNANWFFDWPTKTPASRYRQGPKNELCKDFLERVKGWRFFWISNGTSDTAFWIRPSEILPTR